MMMILIGVILLVLIVTLFIIKPISRDSNDILSDKYIKNIIKDMNNMLNSTFLGNVASIINRRY